jgi:hypothetical protein
MFKLNTMKMEEAGKEELGGNGGVEPSISDLMKTIADLTELVTKPEPKGKDDGISASERAAQAVLDAKKGEDDNTSIRADISFDMGFDKLVNEQKHLFKTDIEFMRKGVDGLQGKELTHALKCIAVKDFFSSESNQELLTSTDLDYVKGMLPQHDNNVDSAKAFSVMEQAMHIAKRLNKSDQYRNSGGGDNGSSTPVLDAFIEKSRKRVRGEK